MRAFLDKKFLLIIILITSCNETPDNNSNQVNNEEKIIEAVFEIPIVLDDEFKQENNLNKNNLISINGSDILIKFRQFY